MKQGIICTLLVAALLGSGCAQQSGPATVSGTWARKGATEVSLFGVVMGRLEKLADCRLQDDQTFTFAFTPQTEGYYVIGAGAPAQRSGKYVFYFKPGDYLNLAVNDTSYTLPGKNTKENRALHAWHDFMLPLERNAFYPPFMQTYTDYFPVLEEKTAKNYKAAGTGNRAFDQSFAKFRTFDLLHCALNFYMTPRSAQPSSADFPVFYHTIKLEELTANTDILLYPYSFLSLAAIVEGQLAGNPVKGPRELIDRVKNDTIKGEMVLQNLAMVREYPVLESMKAQYGSYIITKDQQQRMQQHTDRIMEAHNASGIGKPAINFTYKDPNGKSVSLSDFKGKVVYVDVWATWCAPCRKEFPYLKELEEKFRGNKDMVFMGVSTDAPKDLQKWKDFIVAEQLPGIQIHGGNQGDDAITKLYQIGTIPHFLLFDKQGNIVSVDAPRPSSPELLPLLTSLLK